MIDNCRFKDDKKIGVGNEDKYETNYDVHTGTCTLYVKDVVEDDDGSYRCEVSDESGATNTRTCQLCVQKKNRFV